MIRVAARCITSVHFGPGDRLGKSAGWKDKLASNDRQSEFLSGAAGLADGPRVISYQRARTPAKAVMPSVS